jgi:ribose transport system permease protein
VLSLVLTLLVPVIGRYLNFISPFAAFMFLGCIVAGIMLDVGTSDSLTTAASGTPAAAAPVTASGHLLTRYLLLPPGDGGSGVSLVFSPLQKIVFGIAAFCLIAAISFRVMVVEAMSRRFGAFLYVFVGALILLLLFAIADQSRAWSLFSVVARQP